MPLILIIFGIIFVITGWRNTELEVFNIFKTVLLGNKNTISYLQWAFALFIVAVFGYIKEIRPIVIALIVVLFIAMVDNKNNKGVDILTQIDKYFVNIKKE